MKIVTLTVNPALDKSTFVDYIKPESKLRCQKPVFEAGGGGINVSRALNKLGYDSLAVFLAGGPIGEMLESKLTEEGVHQHVIETVSNTRENFTVVNLSTNEQYRYGMPGSEVMESEWMTCLDSISELEDCEILVLSGSLPIGVPDDFYAQAIRIAKKKNIKVILDTSGPSLDLALEEGVFLIKPNINELRAFTGKDIVTDDNIREAAQEFIRQGRSEIVIVSLGEVGAKLFTIDQEFHAIPPQRKKNSTVGAGDSMVAGMTAKLSEGAGFDEVIKYGVACGTAATMSNGTGLCDKGNVDELMEGITLH